MTLQFHPLAELFPLMDGAEFDALVADIKEHGLREPIVLHEGKILDGRNRYRACVKAGAKVRTEEWDQDGTAQAFVVSKNLHRRHLNETQRALIAARLVTTRAGDNQATVVDMCVTTRAEAAELLNVSPSSVSNARTVLQQGTAEEVKALESGDASARTIAEQIRAKLPTQKRKRMRGESIAQVGKNPERIQRQQVNAEVWGRIRDALTHLTSLPLPADVVAIARAHDKSGFVDARLAQSIKWLEEFSNEWRNRNEDAA